jgi:alkaline phosphatase
VRTKIKLSAVFLTLMSLVSSVFGQAIWAHNDYLKEKPLLNAFEKKAEYIEADVFLENGALLVAHTKKEIDPSKTLERMYLEPLTRLELYDLSLAIDMKTGGPGTMEALIKLLEKYPTLISSPYLHFVLSGEYPAPSEWGNYPNYIWFDGRPNVDYTPEQLKRIKLISTSFSGVSTWNGEGEIPDKEFMELQKVIDRAHNLQKPVRFWAMPDFKNSWEKLEAAGVDIINTDKVNEVYKLFR